MENPQDNAPLIAAVITAILASIAILRNINELIQHLKRLLTEITENWRLRNEKERTELQEQRLRVAFWSKAIQLGYAEDKLKTLAKGIEKDDRHHA